MVLSTIKSKSFNFFCLIYWEFIFIFNSNFMQIYRVCILYSFFCVLTENHLTQSNCSDGWYNVIICKLMCVKEIVKQIQIWTKIDILFEEMSRAINTYFHFNFDFSFVHSICSFRHLIKWNGKYIFILIECIYWYLFICV